MALASLAKASLAQAPTKSLKDQVVGHWQLVSVTVNDTASYGANPQGSMFVDAGGHFSVIVISSGDATSIAYFGTFVLNDADKSGTGHIEGVVGGSGTGVPEHDEKRSLSLNGDELTVQSQMPSGALGSVKLTWKRAD